MNIFNEHRLIHFGIPDHIPNVDTKQTLESEESPSSFNPEDRLKSTIGGIKKTLDDPQKGNFLRESLGFAPADPENAIKMPINKERIDGTVANFNSSDGGEKAKRILAAKLGTEGVLWSADDISKPFNPTAEQLQDASLAGGMAQFMLRITSFISLFTASKMEDGEGSFEDEAGSIDQIQPQWSELANTFEEKGVLNATEKKTFIEMFEELKNFVNQNGNEANKDEASFVQYAQEQNPKYADIIQKIKKQGSWDEVDKLL